MAGTAKDVAREAQVSVAIVSRVVNGHSNVTGNTRARIIVIADRLRYLPDHASRRLVTGLTHTAGEAVRAIRALKGRTELVVRVSCPRARRA